MMGALGMLTQSLVQVLGIECVPKGVTACLEGNGTVPKSEVHAHALVSKIRRPVEEAGQHSEAALRTQRLMALLTPHETAGC